LIFLMKEQHTGLLAGPLDCKYNFNFLFVWQQLKGEYNPDELCWGK